MSPKSPLPIAIAIALLVSPLARAEPPYGDSPRGSESRRPPPHETAPDHPSQCPFFLCVVLPIVSGVVLADAMTGDQWISREDLDRDGPRFPSKLAPGQFQVQGYAAPGWPVVFDFDAPPGADTWLEVALEGFDRKGGPRYRLEPAVGRRVVVVTLPQGGGFDHVIRARYTLYSKMTSGGRSMPADLKVYGMGCGPRAVGSMTLVIDQLQPLDAPGPDAVSFVLDALRPFDRSATEILRLPEGNSGDLALVRDARALPLTLGPHDGRWATMHSDAREGPGLYILQARAWLVGARNDERDWTGAYGPGPVRLR
jgi:hypothetical protein